jgi:phosphoketolase
MCATALRSHQRGMQSNRARDASRTRVDERAIKLRSGATCAAAIQARKAEIDDDDSSVAEMAARAPKGKQRMDANPNGNARILRHDLHMPDFRLRAVCTPFPGAVDAEDIVNLNPSNSRSFGPDETLSNLLGAVFGETSRPGRRRA